MAANVCSHVATSKGSVPCAFFRTTTSDYPDVVPVAPFTHPEVSDTDYCIQHIKDKPALGIALSGGGYRAATCAAGWVRGLHKVRGGVADGHSRKLNPTP